MGQHNYVRRRQWQYAPACQYEIVDAAPVKELIEKIVIYSPEKNEGKACYD